jgi:putative flippase GtrA
VGFGAFLIDFIFFNLFYKINSNFIFSRIVGVVLSMVFNFSTNRKFTFKSQDKKIKFQMIRWLSVYGFSSLINILMGKLTLLILSENVFSANIAFFVGLCFSIPLNYFLSLTWVFKNRILKRNYRK